MVSKDFRSGSRMFGARALFRRLCAKWSKQKKNWRKCVSGLQKCFIFIVFSIYQSIYMHGDKDKDIRSWIHWDWYHIHSLLFWQPFQTYIDINTICINVNKMQSSLVFANSFTVMYKSVCLCFLYDLKHLLLSACRPTTISDWCARVMHYNIHVHWIIVSDEIWLEFSITHHWYLYVSKFLLCQSCHM